MKTSVRLAAVLFGFAVLAGCAKPPNEAIQAANQAVETARSAEAPTYAPASWASVLDAQDKLQAEIRAQENSVAVFRSYNRAETLAEATRATAEATARVAQTAKEQAENDASDLIEQAKMLQVEVQNLMAGAPQGKDTVADLAALKSDTLGSEGSITTAEAAFKAGQYADAKAKASAALQALEDTKAQLHAVQQARNARSRA